MQINLPELPLPFQLSLGSWSTPNFHPSTPPDSSVYPSSISFLSISISEVLFLLFFEVICPMVMEFYFSLASNSVYWSKEPHLFHRQLPFHQMFNSFSLPWHCNSFISSQPLHLLFTMSKHHLSSCENAAAWPEPTIPEDWSILLSWNTEVQ